MGKSAVTWHAKQRGLNITRLIARDGPNCSICGQALDRKLKAQGRRHPPGYITFDHIITRSAGGLTTPENLRLAHARCNWERGNDPLIEDE